MPIRLQTAAALAALLMTVGCASAVEEDAASPFIAAMDAKPAEERLPHWDETRALMMRRAPRVGDPAPDFELSTRDGRGRMRLSKLWTERPVVLIFGSFT